MTDRDIDDKLSWALNADPIRDCVLDLIASEVSERRLVDRLYTKPNWPLWFRRKIQNLYRDYTRKGI